MELESYFEFLTPTDIRLKDTELGIEKILYEYIHRRRPAHDITQTYHSISLEQVCATILFYLHNREEVHLYMTAWVERSLLSNQMELRQQVLAENAPKYESKSDKRIKYLLDENVNPRLGVGLRSQWPEMTAWCIGDPGAPPRGTLDPDILIWCELHDFILITNNRASMPVHLQEHLVAGHHSPGVITLTDKMSMGAVIESLGDLYKLSDSDNYSDNISYMPL